MSKKPNPLDVSIVKCLVITKLSVVDMTYAATVVNLNILDHLACVKNSQMCQQLRWSPFQLQTMPTMGEKEENSQSEMWKQHVISRCS